MDSPTASSAKASAERTAAEAKRSAADVAGDAKKAAADVADEAKKAATDLKGTVTDEAKRAADEVASQAKSVAGDAKEQATGVLSDVSAVLDDASDSLRENNRDAFADYAAQAADSVERFTSGIRDRNVGEILDEAERFARREPGLFIGGAFLLGIFGARFLKASAPGGTAPEAGRASGGQQRYAVPGSDAMPPSRQLPDTPDASYGTMPRTAASGAATTPDVTGGASAGSASAGMASAGSASAGHASATGSASGATSPNRS